MASKTYRSQHATFWPAGHLDQKEALHDLILRWQEDQYHNASMFKNHESSHSNSWVLLRAGDLTGGKQTEFVYETVVFTFSHFSLQSLKKKCCCVLFFYKKSHNHLPLGAEIPRKSRQTHSVIRGGAPTYSELLKYTDNHKDRHTSRIWNLQSPQISLVKIRVADSFVIKLQLL